VHFTTDPGVRYDWTSDYVYHPVNQTHSDIIELIARYVDIKQVPIGQNQNEQRLRRNSCGEQQKSRAVVLGQQPMTIDDVTDKSASLAAGVASSTRKEKKTTSRGIQAVTKTINSLGRSFTRKFQPSANKNDDPRKNIAKKTSTGTATQSTKTSGISVELLADRSRVIKYILV
jgi:hypothetical protein